MGHCNPYNVICADTRNHRQFLCQFDSRESFLLSRHWLQISAIDKISFVMFAPLSDYSFFKIHFLRKLPLRRLFLITANKK